jgi:AraC-like DNA-binding protein
VKSAIDTQYAYFPISPRDRQWGLFVTTAGEAHVPAGSIYPPQGHPGGYHFDWDHGRVLDEFQLVYISRGAGILEMPAGKRWQLEASNLFVLFPGVWHRYRPDANTGWDEHWVGFDGRIVRGAMMRRFCSSDAPVLRVRSEDRMLLQFGELKQAIASHWPALQQIMAGITFEILGRLYSDQQGSSNENQRGDEGVRQAIRLMNENSSGRMSMHQIARQLRLSYSYFRRMFKQQSGMSPHQYWMDLKMARARSLLGDPSLSVKQVAFRAGFDSEQYFCRLFKQKHGYTPGEFRTRRRKMERRKVKRG